MAASNAASNKAPCQLGVRRSFERKGSYGTQPHFPAISDPPSDPGIPHLCTHRRHNGTRVMRPATA